ncbi:hypothetical protein H0264_22750 [Nocardia huaxiensis]|uniref:Uncharacterized protein n=1 Tax=Nocardia huaxiensis TaxID=2755382 RepID=A0A7D6YZD6_9NOCA|nr:hypothetical protein [Nocardia huaxiensis]QLY28206.1 hypothetical protein H0264_22750 [Nocardia huaxiensis]
MAKRSLWARDGLYIDVSLRDSGELAFDAQHLRNGGEYEYALTVPPDQVPLVLAALGGAAGDDVLALLQANAETIVRRGEKSWLESIGVTPGFWSHGDWWDLFDD